MRDADPRRLGRRAWLRPAVLGANDGIVSTASLLVGMASGGASTETLLAAGVAGLVAGATSMAAGEYVSVSSQRDLEEALLARQRAELHAQPDVELAELAATIAARGVDEELASEVARQLMTTDPLAVLARVRLGLSDTVRARPLMAALASAMSYTAGGLIPLGAAFVERDEEPPAARRRTRPARADRHGGAQRRGRRGVARQGSPPRRRRRRPRDGDRGADRRAGRDGALSHPFASG